MNKTTNKVAPNKPKLDALKAQGFEIEIKHFRQVLDYHKGKVVQIEDSEWRNNEEFLFAPNGAALMRYSNPHELGGATEMTLKKGDQEIKVRSECYAKDHFCRRYGVLASLEKIEKFYGIKP